MESAEPLEAAGLLEVDEAGHRADSGEGHGGQTAGFGEVT